MSNPPSLPQSVLEKFAENQSQEIILRSKELEARTNNDKNAHEYAKKALEASNQDREAHRVFYKKFMREKYIFIGVICLMFFIFLGLGLFLNKEQIVMEIVKAIVYLSAGVIGGYGLKSSAQSQKTENN